MMQRTAGKIGIYTLWQVAFSPYIAYCRTLPALSYRYVFHAGPSRAIIQQMMHASATWGTWGYICVPADDVLYCPAVGRLFDSLQCVCMYMYFRIT